MVWGRAAAMVGDEDQDVGDGTQESGCSGVEGAGPQDTGDGEHSEEYMA